MSTRERLDYAYIQVKTYYKYTTFQTFPVETTVENATYNVLFWLVERFLPKSMPAGDYRLDAWFRMHDNVTVFANDTKEFTMRVSRYVCVETPYQRSHLNYCRSQLRRNQPTLFNISVHVPERLDYMYIQVKTYYKYNTFQTFPVEVVVEVCSFLRNPSPDVISRHILSVLIELMPAYAHHCPHGNVTYNVLFWLEERFLPKSMPAGDYRLDAWFRMHDNVTFFAYKVFITIRRKGVFRSMIDW
ncbi:uncharacterized protein LOC126572708 [Anopheles aquasalis]|uniref:uncharacterized protein LOC126572708 n=1 Tax=Anopheles aquasalis TaxID=42839 RepID=UPI00215A87A4|nr:uncharacterized protein LOC126572708 [Anopheles aquasalis]